MSTVKGPTLNPPKPSRQSVKQANVDRSTYGGFLPKLRHIIFWCPHWGRLILGNYHMSSVSLVVKHSKVILLI